MYKNFQKKERSLHLTKKLQSDTMQHRNPFHGKPEVNGLNVVSSANKLRIWVIIVVLPVPRRNPASMSARSLSEVLSRMQAIHRPISAQTKLPCSSAIAMSDFASVFFGTPAPFLLQTQSPDSSGLSSSSATVRLMSLCFTRYFARLSVCWSAFSWLQSQLLHRVHSVLSVEAVVVLILKICYSARA